MIAKKTFFNWSTGKDSAFALWKLLQDPQYSVEHLLTSVNSHFDRVSMHGLRRSLLERQLDALNIPASTLELPEAPSMEEYDDLMRSKIQSLKKQGFTHAAFGDIFLEDLKTYRDKKLAEEGLTGVYPLWKISTKELLTDFIDQGFKTILISINLNQMPEEFCGRIIDKEFLKDLPKNVDPCGENGEFHTFCFDAPIFEKPISFELGEKEFRSYPDPTNKDNSIRYAFQDLK